MSETWLHSNRRTLALGLILAEAGSLAGILLAVLASDGYAKGVGVVMLLLSTGVTVVLLARYRRPRLAYEPGSMLVYLNPGAPYRVPIDCVEGCLLGQGPGMLPGRHQRAETSTIVVRIAERAVDWSEREVQPALGKWCGGYITIRGTWCEPISLALVQRLNEKIDAARRAWAAEGAPK